jgi:lipid-A-disaccharide synthase
MGIRVVYLIAPQVWAWRKGRLPRMRRVIDRLLCIFPFEEAFFRQHGIAADYIGHPLTRMVRSSAPVLELRRRFGAPDDAQVVALLPGSRPGEIARHLPVLLEAAGRLANGPRPIYPILALPPGIIKLFKERFSLSSIQVQEGQTWDVLACSDLALAASGTVTIEACLLNTPMVTFYRVNGLSWVLGKLLVRVPFYSMVNLVAGRQVVPELMQGDMTAERLAAEAGSLLQDDDTRRRMREDLAGVARRLMSAGDPMQAAQSVITELLDKEMVHVS